MNTLDKDNKALFSDKGYTNLTDEQLHILNLSEQDIKDGRLISQFDLDASDVKWLSDLHSEKK